MARGCDYHVQTVHWNCSSFESSSEYLGTFSKGSHLELNFNSLTATEEVSLLLFFSTQCHFILIQRWPKQAGVSEQQMAGREHAIEFPIFVLWQSKLSSGIVYEVMNNTNWADEFNIETRFHLFLFADAHHNHLWLFRLIFIWNIIFLIMLFLRLSVLWVEMIRNQSIFNSSPNLFYIIEKLESHPRSNLVN